tara:strand:+ start:234 stop:722 length:489 start_codon:yes stop_codon:yes gene_type:complete
MEVIDDFLPEEQFNTLASTMMSANFPWYFANSVLSKDLLCREQYNYQFGHSFYYNYGFKSEYSNLIIPILEKLDPIAILRIKGILLPRTETNIEHGFHLDNHHKTKVAIYYVNTNNGYTKFADDGIINSVANRLVLFNSKDYHTGATCTDEKIRVAINFNYY